LKLRARYQREKGRKEGRKERGRLSSSCLDLFATLSAALGLVNAPVWISWRWMAVAVGSGHGAKANSHPSRGERRRGWRKRALETSSITFVVDFLSPNVQHTQFSNMSNAPRSPHLPWEVIGNIIKANWIEPIDLSTMTSLDLSLPPSASFHPR